jgi:large subunit ribosomal protein L16
VSGQVLEAGRIAAMHFVKREGKLFIRVFPDKPISKKPLETRMGTGKADVDYWAARVKPGTVLFEIAGVSEAVAKQALVRVAMKMPVRTRFVSRRVSV